MKFDFSGNSMWHLVMQSDFITWLILLALFAMSVLCWAVFFYKLILLRIKKQEMKKALTLLRSVRTFEELRAVIASLSDTLPGFLLQSHLGSLKTLLEDHPNNQKLMDHQIDLLNLSIDQTVEQCIFNEESYLSVLFTCASAAPLIGLFGTVWGLIHAFIGISEKQTADISAVAPGIAEALIATLGGLVVAIPALMMYHYLNVGVKTMEQQLFATSDRFNWIVQRLFAE